MRYTMDVPVEMDRRVTDAVLELVDRASPEGSTPPARARLGEGGGRRWVLVVRDDRALLDVPGEEMVELCERPGDLCVLSDGTLSWEDPTVAGDVVVMSPLVAGARLLGWEVRVEATPMTLVAELRGLR